MKKFGCGIMILALLCVLFVTVPWMWTSSGFRYIERSTGVTLPHGCTAKRHKGGNGWTLGFLKLPSVDVEGFLKTNEFRSVSEIPTPEQIANDDSGKLKWDPLYIYGWFKHWKVCPQIPNDSSMMYLRGKNNDRWPWEILVDPRTGRLWVYVGSADFGGN